MVNKKSGVILINNKTMQNFYIGYLLDHFDPQHGPVSMVLKRNYASTFSWCISMQVNPPLMLKDSHTDDLASRRPAACGLGTKPKELNNRKGTVQQTKLHPSLLLFIPSIPHLAPHPKIKGNLGKFSFLASIRENC